MNVSWQIRETRVTDLRIVLADTGTQDYSPYFTVQPGMVFLSVCHVNLLIVSSTSSYRISFLAGWGDQD